MGCTFNPENFTTKQHGETPFPHLDIPYQQLRHSYLDMAVRARTIAAAEYRDPMGDISEIDNTVYEMAFKRVPEYDKTMISYLSSAGAIANKRLF